MKLLNAVIVMFALMLAPQFATAASVTCNPGWGFNGSGCSKCIGGYYAPAGGQSICIAADSGHYVPTSGATAQIACAPGYYTENQMNSKCFACPAGRYAPGQGTYNCKYPDAGYYVPAAGASSQIKCAAGTYSHPNAAGRTLCLACPRGYSSPAGSSSENQCQAILYANPADYYNGRGVAAPGTKKNSPHKCDAGKNWKGSAQACK